MRLLIVFLLACASGLASDVFASATCNAYTNSDGNWVGAVFSASCFDSTTSAEGDVSISGASVGASSNAFAPGEGDSHSGAYASLYAYYVLTVTGGTGGGFFAPTFSGGHDMFSQVGGSASIESPNNSCSFSVLELPSSCPPNMSFVFDTPETLTVSLSVSENLMATDLYVHYGDALVACCSFEFFDDGLEPLTGVSYTFVPAPGETPTPEPGTFLLFVGAGCAALVRRLLR